MKEYGIYLFDFDYTLADSGDGIALCFQKLLANHGYFGVNDEDIKRTIGLPLKECFPLLADISDPDELEAWRVEFENIADECMIEHIPLFKNTEAMLRRLKNADKKVGIISSKRRELVVRTLNRFDIEKYIDILISIDDIPVPKPAPSGIFNAIAALNGDAANVIYTGDSTIDALAAKNAGVDFCAVTTGVTPKEDFLSLPHIMITDDIGNIF